MQIQSIILQNFGCYRDLTKIEFATGKKNVTIIEGEMGHGKSSLLNAFYWCLFDKYWHNKKSVFIDEPNPNKEKLININEFEKCRKEKKTIDLEV